MDDNVARIGCYRWWSLAEEILKEISMSIEQGPKSPTICPICKGAGKDKDGRACQECNGSGRRR
jgi:RecJ-like exonuclease